MKISYKSKERSGQKEIMDDFSFGGEEMKLLLRDLQFVNRWLGGNSVTLGGIRQLLKTSENNMPRILDIGCGDGVFLRYCADRFKTAGIQAEFVGVDANPQIIEEARLDSPGYNNIEFVHANVFDNAFTELKYDIAVCNLFLHHLNDQEVEKLLEVLSQNAKVGVVVNDLHRSRLAFVLFKFVSIFLLRTKIARNDGLISITRGFKRSDFKKYSAQLKLNSVLNWKWAFRYLWIINTQNER